MHSITLSDLPIPKVHQYLLGSIGPRPICFASTLGADGTPNLSPFSFFNVFSANPPIVIFSPARSGRTGQTKDTHENSKEIPEVVINVVNYDLVQQMNLSSSPYPKGVNEFEKAGLTMLESELVRPYRVKESPIQMECKVLEVKELGEQGAAGNLVICEVLRMHFHESILNEAGMVDQERVDLVSRMGGNWYCRAHGEALFEVPKLLAKIAIGIDALPEYVRHSDQLSGNQLGLLGSVEALPEASVLAEADVLEGNELFDRVQTLLDSGSIEMALALLIKNLQP